MQQHRGWRGTGRLGSYVRARVGVTSAVAALVACGGDTSGSSANALGQRDAGEAPDAARDEPLDSEAADVDVTDAAPDRVDGHVDDGGVADASDALAPIDGAAVTARVREGLTLSACDADAGFLGGALGSVVLTPPVDYLDARGGGEPGPGPYTFANHGVACGGADAGACADAFASLRGAPRSPGWFAPDASPYGNGIALVYTRGDTAGLVLLQDAGTFFGRITSLPPAVLVAFLADHQVQCGPGTASIDPDGIRIATRRGSDCAPIGLSEERLLVKPDATVVIERSELLVRPPTPYCVP